MLFFLAFPLLFLFFLSAFSGVVLFKNEYTNIIYSIPQPIYYTGYALPNPYYSTCPASLSIMGGYKIFFDSLCTFNYCYFLPTHTSIKVAFTLYLLDYWSGDSIEILFDSVSVSKNYYYSNGTSNICGNSSYTDMILNISINRSHSSSNFALQIHSGINLTNDNGTTTSWGMRDLLIYIDVPCPFLCLGCIGGFCTNLSLFAQQDVNFVISCKDGFFSDIDNNICSLCHYSCLTCQGAGPYNCTSCFEFYSLDNTLNSCNHTSPYAQSHAEFTEVVIPDSIATDPTWVINMMTNKTSVDRTCFFPIHTVGGYQIMNETSYLIKNITTLLPHYRVSVRFHVFISGNISDFIKIYIDNNFSYAYNFFYGNPSPYLINKTCKTFLLFHQQMYYAQNHQSSSIAIKINTTASGLYYWGINNFVFELAGCDSSCKNCSGPASNQCTSCYGFATLTPTNSCVCNAGYTLVLGGTSCNPCSISCKTCSLITTNCTSCNANSYLEGNICHNPCTNGLYGDDIDNTCKICDSSCLTCSKTATNCTSCPANTYLYLNTCVNICPNGTYNNDTDYSCNVCDQISQTCMYFLQTTVNLYKNYSNPNFYLIIFSNFTSSLLEKIENYQNQSFYLTISNISTLDYKYNFSRSSTQNGTFILSFNFSKTVSDLNVLTILFNTSFLQDPFSIFLINNLSTNLAFNIIYITPSLKTTSDPQILILSFSSQISYLFERLESISFVTISNFAQDNYNFSIKNTSNPLVFSLILSYKSSLIGIHSLNLSFSTQTPDFDIINKKLTKNSLIIQPLNFYILSQSTKKALEDTKKASTFSSQSANSAISVASVVNSESSIAFYALLLIKLIKFFKFLNINYPPNALAVFEEELNFFNFLPSFHINHADNPADVKFDYYIVDNYVINNKGMLFCQTLLLCLGAMLFNYIFNRFSLSKLEKFRFFSFCFNKIYEILCWNFVFTFLIGSLNDFFFYSVINLAFATNGDFWGVFDVALSIFLVCFDFGLLILMHSKISKINHILCSKEINSSIRSSNFHKINHSSIFSSSFLPNIIAPQKPLFEDQNIANNDLKQTFSIDNPLNSIRSFAKSLKPITTKKNQLVPFVEGKFISGSGRDANDTSSSRMKGKTNNTHFGGENTEINSPSDLFSENQCNSKQMSLSAFKINLNNLKQNKDLVEPAKKIKDELHSNEDCEVLLQKYKILFEDFKQESKLTSLYFLLDLIKFPVISLIIVLDRYRPLRQSCLILALTLGMLIFLIILRPLKSKYLFSQYILSQVSVLFCTLSVFVLAYYDSENETDQEKRLMVGWIIAYGNLGLVSFITLIMIGHTLVVAFRMAKKFYNYLKTWKSRNHVNSLEKTQA